MPSRLTVVAESVASVVAPATDNVPLNVTEPDPNVKFAPSPNMTFPATDISVSTFTLPDTNIELPTDNFPPIIASLDPVIDKLPSNRVFPDTDKSSKYVSPAVVNVFVIIISDAVKLPAFVSVAVDTLPVTIKLLDKLTIPPTETVFSNVAELVVNKVVLMVTCSVNILMLLILLEIY